MSRTARRVTGAALAYGVILASLTLPPRTTGDGVGAWPTWADGVAACQDEDGSTPGQPFPCRWESSEQGNGHGVTFTLTGPN